GAGGLGEVLEPARGLGLALAGVGIPVAHGRLVAEAGMQAVEVARLELPQPQPLGGDCWKDGVGFGHAGLRNQASRSPEAGGRHHSRPQRARRGPEHDLTAPAATCCATCLPRLPPTALSPRASHPPMTKPLLFTPITIRDVTLKNRVVIAP